MKNYIVYLDNGCITKTGLCSEKDFYLQGKNVIEGNADDSCQYIENGQVVDMPAKPDGEAYFDFDSKQWEPDFAQQSSLVKNQRDQLLSQSDWTQIPNNPLTPAKQQEWAVYRQELRDITSQSGYPFNVIWPVQPK